MISWINKNKNFITMSNLKSKISNKYKEKLKIVATDINQRISTLSGGNQQKVVFSRWLAANIEVLMLMEPTEGIDVKTRSGIYRMLTDK